MGRRWRYIYRLYKDGVMVEEGTQTQILDHHYTSPNNLYDCWKKKMKFMKEYRVERIRKEWKPEQKEEYYYASNHGAIKDYFDTNNFTCLCRFYVHNCFQTREEATAQANDLYCKLLKFYENS